MKKELKHPTTFCEQVDRLRSHGVIVNNPDACVSFLERVNYYFPAVPHVTSCSRLKADHKLYSQLYVLKRMYPYPEHWDQDFVHPLRKMMRKYGKDIDKGHLGFPRCWLAILRE